MLQDEISTAQRAVRTDAYQMSIGELVSMYEQQEIIIDPEFQRLFRWTPSQKSKLVESLLLGIPLPSIFVFEKDDGKWELIDGLQRLSTILEFMGALRKPDGGLAVPSVLEATKYLTSLHNVVWEKSPDISDVEENDQVPLGKPQQLAIRRARISVEILKRPSDNLTKFDLFQRLNAGGTQANPQELRNCIMLMVNQDYFQAVKRVADSVEFQTVINATEEQIDKQRHMELAVRFLVHTHVAYDGKLDVEEYIDDGIVRLATAADTQRDIESLQNVFQLLNEAQGANALRRYEGGRHTGKVGLVGLEGIAVGIGRNLPAILALPGKVEFVRERSKEFWQQTEAQTFTSGMRGTTRIQKTVPFGQAWFRPA